MKEKFVPALDFPFLTKSFDLFLTLAMPEKKVKADLIGFLDIKEGEDILDFGCGTGILSRSIRNQWYLNPRRKYAD